MKGIILAAGKGTRLYPLTKTIPKVLLPVYDRPMIYFGLEFMKRVGTKDVIVVVSSENEEDITKALGDGTEFGLNIEYRVQGKLNGTAGAVREVLDFIAGDDVVLYYGDNVLLNCDDKSIEYCLDKVNDGFASILSIEVANPTDYGVIEINDGGEILSIEEKPLQPKSNVVATGIYFYPKDIAFKLENLQLSSRGEYEMTDINKAYLSENRILASKLAKDTLWFDAGNFDRLLEAGITVKNSSK